MIHYLPFFHCVPIYLLSKKHSSQQPTFGLLVIFTALVHFHYNTASWFSRLESQEIRACRCSDKHLLKESKSRHRWQVTTFSL